MANARRKGKIPRAEWPRILTKYGNGETIAKIGRDYGCTAPAIRYIVKRSGMLKGDTGTSRSPGGKTASQPTARRIRASGQNVEVGYRDVVAPPLAAPAARRGSFLGPDLRSRVTGDVATFLAALDQAVIEGSVESLTTLQEAIDDLMRSAARARIELGRLLAAEDAAVAKGGRREREVESGHRA